MAKVLCIKCNYEFPSDAIYETHKKSGHQFMSNGTPLEDPNPQPEVPPGIPSESLPTPEFIAQVQAMETPQPEEPAPTPSTHPTELPPVKELKLTYVWVGECETCRIPPTTIELDVKDSHFVVAVCDRCKQQLQSQEVAKL